MEFSRQEHQSRLSFFFPGDLPNPGMEPGPPECQADSLPSEPPRKPMSEALTSYSILTLKSKPQKLVNQLYLFTYLYAFVLIH